MKINERTVVIAWDLDETLGYFVELGMLWDTLEKYSSISLTNKDFFKLLDLYPEFLRPEILTVLTLLKNKKKQNKNLSVIIFTNNQGPKSWAELIVAYFNHKLKYDLFDLIIPAYKVNGKQVSSCRTSHDKKYEDLLSCMNLPKETQVCFIDDQDHTQMKRDDVYYIHLKGYETPVQFSKLMERFQQSSLPTHFNVDNTSTIKKMRDYLDEYHLKIIRRSKKDVDLDRIITKKLYNHIQTFLKNNLKKHSKTRRKRTRSFKRTFKIF